MRLSSQQKSAEQKEENCFEWYLVLCCLQCSVAVLHAVLYHVTDLLLLHHRYGQEAVCTKHLLK